jgi:predicted dithiol-disulfide oxidoreductase (DUF899 family)
MMTHEIVDRPAWLRRRLQLLDREKAFMRAKDDLARERRSLPWVRLDKEYVFQGPNGPLSLADSFGARSQLLVYHLMFAPDWEAACKSCSFWADHFDACLPHLSQRDAAFVAISRAPLAKLQAYARRLGWKFEWLSSGETDFNYDFGVSFRPEDLTAGRATYNYAPADSDESDSPGFSVFYKDPDGAIFHTYSTYGRGIELANGTYQLLDLLPKGRDEDHLQFTMSWVRRHDEYN